MHWAYSNEAYTINADELVMKADLNLVLSVKKS